MGGSTEISAIHRTSVVVMGGAARCTHTVGFGCGAARPARVNAVESYSLGPALCTRRAKAARTTRRVLDGSLLELECERPRGLSWRTRRLVGWCMRRRCASSDAARHWDAAMRCDAMRCDAMRCDAMRCVALRCDALRCVMRVA